MSPLSLVLGSPKLTVAGVADSGNITVQKTLLLFSRISSFFSKPYSVCYFSFPWLPPCVAAVAPPPAGGVVMMQLNVPGSAAPRNPSPPQRKPGKYYCDHPRGHKATELSTLDGAAQVGGAGLLLQGDLRYE